MSVESSLKTTLGNAAGVTALVSNRVYPGIAEKDTAMPYIVYSRSGTQMFNTLAGVNDPSYPSLDIECVGSTYASAKAVAAAVVTALQGNGNQQFEYDLYDNTTQRHSIFLGWSFAD